MAAPSPLSSAGSETTGASSRRRVDTSFDFPRSYEESEPFTKPHTVAVLLFLIGCLAYAVVGKNFATDDWITNTKHGVVAALCVGLVFCAEHLRDTLFVRPHPAIWRFVTGVGLFYAMCCAFALFQDVETVRNIMRALDPVHAVTADKWIHKSYGEQCEFTWENWKAQTDIFVAAHLIGWMFKSWMIRDFWISMTLSFLFELMEYTFEFLQPNFIECWWDHWLLDFALCNFFGILLGHWVMEYLESKNYNWVGLGQVRSVRGKVQRLLAQFTPREWTAYKWGILADFRRFTYVVTLVVGILLVELDAFFLKHVFMVMPPSKLNLYRLIIWWAVGMVGLRDYYAFMTDSRIKRLGSTGWVMLAMMLLEFILVLRFGSEVQEWTTARVPLGIVVAWGVVLVPSTIYFAWWFLVAMPRRRKARSDEKAAVAQAAVSAIAEAAAPAAAQDEGEQGAGAAAAPEEPQGEVLLKAAKAKTKRAGSRARSTSTSTAARRR